MKKQLFDMDWEYHEFGFMPLEMTAIVPWQPINLPHDACIVKPRDAKNPSGSPEGFVAGGVVYYKKTINVTEECMGKQALLEFEGVCGTTEVILNKNLIATHHYAYTGFQVDLTTSLEPGENTLIVIVNDSAKPSARWYQGTGIYRHVWLHTGENVHVKPWGLQVSTPKVSTEHALVDAKVKITNSENYDVNAIANFKLYYDSYKVAEGTANVALAQNKENMASTQIAIDNPMLWSVEEPNLYKVVCEVSVEGIVVDSVESTMGIRDVSFDIKNGFQLNGVSMKLKGGSVHHDHGPLGAASYDRAEERKAELLKASGFNAVRLAHNPFSPAFLDACDRLGLLVVDEAFDVWRVGMTANDYHLWFEKDWQQDLASMILRDYNHPSVIIWAVGNEIMERDGQSEGYAWAKKIIDFTKELDPTRAVNLAVCGLMDEVTGELAMGNLGANLAVDKINPNNDRWADKTEKFLEAADVVGYNYLNSRYEYDATRFPNRIIMGTESYASTQYDNWVDTVKNSNVVGDFVWTAIDYLGEVGVGRIEINKEVSYIGAAYPWFYASVGDMDVCGFKRPQSYFRDVLWGNRKKPYIGVLPPAYYGQSVNYLPWGWEPVENHWSFPEYEGKPTRVDVYSDADEVELVINGISQGRKPAGADVKLTASFDVMYSAGTIEAIAYKDGIESARETLTTSGAPVSVKLTVDRESIKAEYGDLAYITAEVVDKNGDPVSYAENDITFNVSGNGDLIAIGSGDPVSEEFFTANHRKLFKGKALAVIRSNGNAGEVIIEATADGLNAAQCIINTI
ncbi:glycoside hydrolase family 2 TIM barrel-domain containing protein [Paenibacillus polymyxa]|uniref:glycoside hydrolase family 2 TIM barrel-domain containing protein n=1 Tax=Paenibacillus polymyxa TaxID=1406 RepID=UPI002AB5410A|nr:glycoside hydrolase family 2 TIM barrel-domain containing protein [Paenibacillus polymyxa]MDY8025490.1 glycoside hydrolase family 2 TIM barrel-domain containing protein [Paenibacillus polymyxa]